jgi:hypothetical protein
MTQASLDEPLLDELRATIVAETGSLVAVAEDVEHEHFCKSETLSIGVLCCFGYMGIVTLSVLGVCQFCGVGIVSLSVL